MTAVLPTAGTTPSTSPTGTMVWPRAASAVIPIPPDIPLPADADLRKRYGITIDDYVRLLAGQGWVCRMCHLAPLVGEPLVVDHDHDPPHRIDGLIHRGENRYAKQQARRYFRSDPPVELFVPPEREEMAARKRIREKAAAKAKRQAARQAPPAPATAQDRFHAGPVPKIGARP